MKTMNGIVWLLERYKSNYWYGNLKQRNHNMNMSFESVTPYRQSSKFTVKKKNSLLRNDSDGSFFLNTSKVMNRKSCCLANLLSLILVLLGVGPRIPQIEHWWDEFVYRRYKSDMKIKFKLTAVVIENIQLVSQLYGSIVIGWKRRVEICHSGITTILHRSVSRARSSVVVTTVKKECHNAKHLKTSKFVS